MPTDDVVAQRIALRPELLCQRLIDDDHGRPAFVLFRKCAAPQDGNFEGLEIAGGNQRPSRDALGSRPFGTSRNLEASAEAAPPGARNKSLPRPRRPEARGCGEGPREPLGSRSAGFSNCGPVSDMRIVKTLMRIEAGIHLPDRDERSDQQRRPDQ